MAVCALASARARDGSLFSARWNPAQLNDPPPEVFYDIAKDSITSDLISMADHNCMRACALLAITNIQSGQIRLMHRNLAQYYAMVAMDGLHDEANWPKDVGIVEVEERRRLVNLTNIIESISPTPNSIASSGQSIPWMCTPPLFGLESYAIGKLSATFYILPN